MAIFIPSVPESFNSSYGEEEVFNSLKILDDKYSIFYSLSWVGIDKRTLGEADFVISHPEKGILVIEVKSGEIEFKNGEWFQTNRKTKYRKTITPFSQAKRSRYEIEDRLRKKLKYNEVPLLCYCVWFPSIEIKPIDELPPEADKRIVLDEKSLLNPVKAIDRAFSFWKDRGKRYRKLDSKQYKRVFDILCPYFHAVPKLSNSIIEAEKYYIRLTNQQVALLNFLQEQKTAVVHGLAGTGKTVLAVEKARMLAELGDNVLFLCYNSFLKDYLRKSNNMPNVIFHNAHTLAYEMLPDPNMNLDEILIMFEDYLEEVYEAEDWPYNNVIIDEGQDLDDCLLNRLYELVKAKNGCFYVFYDRNQYIMKNKKADWIEKAECRLVLHKNCRNTVEIFRSACSILGTEASSYSNNIHGNVPDAFFYRTEDQLLSIVNRFVKNALDGGLLPHELVILSGSTIEKSWLNSGSICGCLISKTFCEDSILFSTIRKFKGLEAKAILLIDISMSELIKEETKRLIYVGSTRAKYLLNLAILEDVESSELGEFLRQINNSRNVPKNKKGFGRLLNININKYKI